MKLQSCWKILLGCTLYSLGWVGVVFPQSASAEDSLSVPLKNAQGKPVGSATFTQLKQGVRIEIEAKGLSPGEHAFHIHESGQCQAPDFKSAGDHYNPGERKHGFNVSQGPHAGDMPNLIVGKDGLAHTEVINTEVSLKKGPNALLKEGGTSLVIHASEDDYLSQPAGNAGGRVACGEIKRKTG